MTQDIADQSFLYLCIRKFAGEATTGDFSTLHRLLRNRQRQKEFFELKCIWRYIEDPRAREEFDANAGYRMLCNRLSLTDGSEFQYGIAPEKSDEWLSRLMKHPITAAILNSMQNREGHRSRVVANDGSTARCIF